MKNIYTIYDKASMQLTLFDGKKNHNIDIQSLKFINGYALVEFSTHKDKLSVPLSIVTVINQEYKSVIYPLTDVYRATILPGGNLLASVKLQHFNHAYLMHTQLNQEYCRNKSEISVDAQYPEFLPCNSPRAIKIVDTSAGIIIYLQLFDYVNGNTVPGSNLFESVGDFCPGIYNWKDTEDTPINVAEATLTIPYEQRGKFMSYELRFLIDDTGKIVSLINDEFLGDTVAPPQTEEEMKAFIAARSVMATQHAMSAYTNK